MNLLKKSYLFKLIITLVCIAFIVNTAYRLSTNETDYVKNKPDISDIEKSKTKPLDNETKQKTPLAQDNINKEVKFLLNDYLSEIKNYTSFEIDSSQKGHIDSYLNSEPIYNLSSKVTEEHRKDFDSKRKMLISLWEDHYNSKWPTYTKDIKVDTKILRYKGQNYDAHHIIELSWNGPNEWWNLTPAMYPSQHQNGIHSKDSIASKLFSEK